jgi:hypothetical protein
VSAIVARLKELIGKLLEDVRQAYPKPRSQQPKEPVYDDTDTAKDFDELFDEAGNIKRKEGAEAIKDEEHWWCHPGTPIPDTPVIEALDPRVRNRRTQQEDRQRRIPGHKIPSNVMKTLQILNNPDFDYGDVASLVNTPRRWPESSSAS